MKLYYFDARNLAEPTRMCLAYGGVHYEDVRIKPGDDWVNNYKPKMPHGKVPVLEVDGKYLCESAAICRFVARKHGLVGKTEWEQAKVDELINVQKDFYKELAPYFYSKAGFNEPEKVDQYYEEVAKPVLKKYLTMYTELLEKNGSGFFVGQHESFADFWISDYLFTLNGLVPELAKDYPKLVGAYQKSS
ncbi:hypothetical protein M3Y97_00780900 [Aphelenchoides bicaudatus]|nr:hypothetical protein M3Y97_00780900 [Aphelenchoides bicaudatus]